MADWFEENGFTVYDPAVSGPPVGGQTTPRIGGWPVPADVRPLDRPGRVEGAPGYIDPVFLPGGGRDPLAEKLWPGAESGYATRDEWANARDAALKEKENAFRAAAAQQGIRVDQGGAELAQTTNFMDWQPGQPVVSHIAANNAGGTSGVPAAIIPYGKQFAMPTAAEARAMPGWQFTVDEALRVADTRRSAQGKLRAGMGRDYANLVTGLADAAYAQRYNQALGAHQQNVSDYYQGQGARYDTERTNRMDTYGIFDTNRRFANMQESQYYDRLFGLAGLGDPTREAVTRGAFTGQAADAMAGGANANAAGEVGAANAYSDALGATIPLAQAMYLYPQFFPQRQGQAAA